MARKWSDMVYDGSYFDPLREQIEHFITSTQERVTGDVTVETSGGTVHATDISSPYLLRRDGAVYAQTADWSAEEARGFIKLSGQSAALWTDVGKGGAT